MILSIWIPILRCHCLETSSEFFSLILIPSIASTYLIAVSLDSTQIGLNIVHPNWGPIWGQLKNQFLSQYFCDIINSPDDPPPILVNLYTLILHIALYASSWDDLLMRTHLCRQLITQSTYAYFIYFLHTLIHLLLL